MPHKLKWSLKAKELAKTYTLERCEELLRIDPQGAIRLMKIAKEIKIKRSYGRNDK
jgi:hypothetical protein